MMDFKNSFTVIVEDCSSLFQRAYLLPTASLWFSFFSLLCIPRHYPDRRVLNGINFLRRNDESCVTHSPPQVGVDNLDKYARSFALLYPPRHPNPPVHRLCSYDGRKFPTTSERQVIICHCWWWAALCASRCARDSPPYMSIGGRAACDPPSCSVLRAHSQLHTETSAAHLHASLQIFTDICLHDKAWTLLIAAKDSRWEIFLL